MGHIIKHKLLHFRYIDFKYIFLGILYIRMLQLYSVDSREPHKRLGDLMPHSFLKWSLTTQISALWNRNYVF